LVTLIELDVPLIVTDAPALLVKPVGPLTLTALLLPFKFKAPPLLGVIAAIGERFAAASEGDGARTGER